MYMNQLKKVSFPLILSVFAASLAGCAQTQPSASALPDIITVQNAPQHVITVQGAESVKIVPDMAEIRFGVNTQADDAKTCQEKNSEDLNRVVQFLKASGIPDPSIQTSNYGMNPIYSYTSGQTVIGYEMRTNIIVSDIAIDQAETLLGECVDQGINNIDSVSYLSSQYESCYQEALSKAVATARQKAQVLAEASGCTLGAVIHVEEYSSSQAAKYQNSFTARSASPEAAMGDMIIEPGQLSIQAQVAVEFAIE